MQLQKELVGRQGSFPLHYIILFRNFGGTARPVVLRYTLDERPTSRAIEFGLTGKDNLARNGVKGLSLSQN